MGATFNEAYQNIIVLHAYLTNGFSEFVSALGPALGVVLDKIRRPFKQVQGPAWEHDGVGDEI
jgi:hypothetical protein